MRPFAALVTALGLGLATAVIHAARHPFQLNLRRVQPVLVNGTTTYRPAGDSAPIRSKSVLFENVLGIAPRSAFVFDITKWRLLQGCGLFANLSAKTVSTKDGSVVTIISGDELPAIQFAPEVAVGAKSIDRPEVSGNLLFRDNNFRGTGDRIELMMRTFSRGVEAEAAELPPTIRFKWFDGIRGRPNSCSLTMEEEHVLEDSCNVVPAVFGVSARKGRVQLAVEQVSVCLQGLRTPRRQSSPISQVKYELEPYAISISTPTEIKSKWDKGSSRLSGAKFKLTTKLSNEQPLLSAVDVSTDSGILKSKALGYATAERFTQACIDFTTKSFPLFSFIQRADSSSPSSSSSSPPPPAVYEVTGQLKARLMGAWGSGCLPLYHHAAIEDPQYLRGFSDPTLLPRVPRLGVLKADAYLHGWSQGTPGVFVDVGMFDGLPRPAGGSDSKSSTSSGFLSWFGLGSNSINSATATAPLVTRKLVTMGLSVKTHGLRLEMGWPCSRSLPRLYLSLDA